VWGLRTRWSAFGGPDRRSPGKAIMDDHAIDLSILIHEPEDVYHAKGRECLGSHGLADFRKCPLLYHKDCLGLIAKPDRQAYFIGRATHCRILEGLDEFARRYLVSDGPVNKTTGKPFKSDSQAYQNWADAQGKPIISTKQEVLIDNMAVGVAMNERAVDLIVDGIAEGVVRTDYCGMPCQIRIDWLNPGRGIVDLKTCDDIDYFLADGRRYGYAYQMAFYRSVLAAATGVVVPVHFIAVEKKEPYRAGVFPVLTELLDGCARENAAAIERLKECRRLGVWPTGYEEVRVFDAI